MSLYKHLMRLQAEYQHFDDMHTEAGHLLVELVKKLDEVGNAIADAKDRAGRCLDAERAQKHLDGVSNHWARICEIAKSPALREAIRTHPLFELPEALDICERVSTWAEHAMAVNWLALTHTQTPELLDLYEARVIVIEAAGITDKMWKKIPCYSSADVHLLRTLRNSSLMMDNGSDESLKYEFDFMNRILSCGKNSYPLTGKRASFVEILFDAWERKRPEVTASTIRERLYENVEGGPRDLADLFRNPGNKGLRGSDRYDPVWREAIIKGDRQDTFRLVDPEKIRQKK